MVLDVGRIKHRGDLMHKSIGSNGSAVPSNWRLSADGLTNVVWTPESPSGTPSFGSNSNEVSYANAAGASTNASRADHVHRGVTSLAHASNTLTGPVELQTEGGLYIVRPAGTQILKLGSTGGTGGGGTTITTKDEGSTLSTGVTTLDFTGAGVTASGSGATTTVNIPGGGGSTIKYGSLKPATPTMDFTGSDLASATAHQSGGTFTTGNCFEQAIDGSHMSIGLNDAMGALYWSASNVDQELICGGLAADGKIQVTNAGMYGIALLDTNGTGVGVVIYGDNNAYLADIVTWNYNTLFGTFTNLGHDVNGLPPYRNYHLRLTRSTNTWDGYISLDGNNWSYHSSATGSKTITVAYKVLGMFYNTASTYKGVIRADYLHTP